MFALDTTMWYLKSSSFSCREGETFIPLHLHLGGRSLEDIFVAEESSILTGFLPFNLDKFLDCSRI